MVVSTESRWLPKLALRPRLLACYLEVHVMTSRRTVDIQACRVSAQEEVDDEEFEHAVVDALVNKQHALKVYLSGKKRVGQVLSGRAAEDTTPRLIPR